MRKGIFTVVVPALLAVSSAAGATPGPASPSLVAAFDPSAFELPESVTLDEDGTFYMSMAGDVQRLIPGGELELFASLPIPPGAFAGGVKIGPDGDLYVASGGFSPSPSAAFVWRVEADGTVHQVAALDPAGFPDDLAFDDDGNLYVSDAFLGVIWRVDPAGVVVPWLWSPLLLGDPANPAVVISPFGAVGMAFDRKDRHLYVANLDAGSIVRVPVEDGEPGDPEIFVQDPLLVGADGIAFDNQGTLYTGVHVQDRVAAISPDGTITVVAEGGILDAPASLVFGTEPGDKKTLYITSFAINRALGTQAGTPSPSLVALPVKVKGAPLP
ncbi:MAG: SMP-30/gluconolactonase/LRE family protein [Polyangiaceae bacterium]